MDSPVAHTAVLGASPVFADDKGMSSVSDSKLSVGAASTGDKGARKTVTRGVNIENADYHDKDLSSVSFQQSLVRGTNFKNAKLVAAGDLCVQYSKRSSLFGGLSVDSHS